MQIKFKKLHPDAKIPTKAHPSDAGFDITAVGYELSSKQLSKPTDVGVITYHTGIAIQLPKGYHAELFARSSVYKTFMSLCNNVGVVDESYTGEILFKFYYDSNYSVPYKTGDRIGQIIVKKDLDVEFVEVDELDETERGDNGFGSTGK